MLLSKINPQVSRNFNIFLSIEMYETSLLINLKKKHILKHVEKSNSKFYTFKIVVLFFMQSVSFLTRQLSEYYRLH